MIESRTEKSMNETRVGVGDSDGHQLAADRDFLVEQIDLTNSRAFNPDYSRRGLSVKKVVLSRG
jgi:hypothetical protein